MKQIALKKNGSPAGARQRLLDAAAELFNGKGYAQAGALPFDCAPLSACSSDDGQLGFAGRAHRGQTFCDQIYWSGVIRAEWVPPPLPTGGCRGCASGEAGLESLLVVAALVGGGLASGRRARTART